MENTKNEQQCAVHDSNPRTFTEEDVFNNMAEFVQLFDTSDYPYMTKEEVIADIKKLWRCYREQWHLLR